MGAPHLQLSGSSVCGTCTGTLLTYPLNCQTQIKFQLLDVNGRHSQFSAVRILARERRVKICGAVPIIESKLRIRNLFCFSEIYGWVTIGLVCWLLPEGYMYVVNSFAPVLY